MESAFDAVGGDKSAVANACTTVTLRSQSKLDCTGGSGIFHPLAGRNTWTVPRLMSPHKGALLRLKPLAAGVGYL